MILVTGATGNVGGALALELGAKGIEHRLMVRDRARVGAASNGAEVAVADWDEPATLSKVFDGIDAAFLMFPGIGADHAATVVGAARAAGGKKIVLRSSFNVPRKAAADIRRLVCAQRGAVPGSARPERRPRR